MHESLNSLTSHLKTSVFENGIQRDLLEKIVKEKSGMVCQNAEKDTKQCVENLENVRTCSVCEFGTLSFILQSITGTNVQDTFQDMHKVITEETLQCTNKVKTTMEKMNLSSEHVPSAIQNLTSKHKETVEANVKSQIESEKSVQEKWNETQEKLKGSNFKLESDTKTEFQRVRDEVEECWKENTEKTKHDSETFLSSVCGMSEHVSTVTSKSTRFLSDAFERHNEATEKRWNESVAYGKEQFQSVSNTIAKDAAEFQTHKETIVRDVKTQHANASQSRKSFWEKSTEQDLQAVNAIKTLLDTHTEAFAEQTEAFVKAQIETETSFESKMQSKLSAHMERVNTQNTNMRNTLLAMRAQIDAMLEAQDTFVKQCSEDRQSLEQDIHGAVTDLASRRAHFTKSSNDLTSSCVSDTAKCVQDMHETMKESTQESIRTESEVQNKISESLQSELNTRLDAINTSAENFETRRERIEKEMSEFASKASCSEKESRVEVFETMKSNMSDVDSTLESSEKELKDMAQTCVRNTNERMTNAMEKFDRNTVDKIVSSHRTHADSVLDKEIRERAAAQFKSRGEFLENSLKNTVSLCAQVHESVVSEVVSPVLEANNVV